MKLTDLKVFNFEGAIRGMRNPHESWNKSDSQFDIFYGEESEDAEFEVIANWIENEDGDLSDQKLVKAYRDWFDQVHAIFRTANYTSEVYEAAYIGPKDLKLAQSLIRAGSEHRKFLRQIFISFDLTAPLYFWKEFDTYKINTTSNSTSTMHKLATTPITLDCFEIENFDIIVSSGKSINGTWELCLEDYWDDIIFQCETLRKIYLETKDNRYWKALIQLLPESWLQTRTITINYENALNIIHQRKNHKLSEWKWFVDKLKFELPYSYELLWFFEEEKG